jgi:hypothetical protein
MRLSKTGLGLVEVRVRKGHGRDEFREVDGIAKQNALAEHGLEEREESWVDRRREWRGKFDWGSMIEAAHHAYNVALEGEACM